MAPMIYCTQNMHYTTDVVDKPPDDKPPETQKLKNSYCCSSCHSHCFCSYNNNYRFRYYSFSFFATSPSGLYILKGINRQVVNTLART